MQARTQPSLAHAIEVENLGVEFSGGVHALRDVSLRVGANEMVAIIGPSGAGKSTLLRSINRLVDPTSGTMRVNGVETTGVQGRRVRDLRAQTGMIFQQFNLVSRLTVLQNVLVGRLRFRQGLFAMWPTLVRWFNAEDHAAARRSLEQVGIAELASRRASDLSGGQQQRVAIAKVLAQGARVILADEPIASLDPRSARVVMDTLATINRETGVPVLVNLHHVEVARRYASRIIGMRQGRVVFDGPAGALTTDMTRDLYGEDVEHTEKGANEPVLASGESVGLAHG
jgi:phosphonate transport system ATP-binding protein